MLIPEATSVENLCDEQILNTGIHNNSNTSHSVADFHITTPDIFDLLF